jgi:hypothetical protein
MEQGADVSGPIPTLLGLFFTNDTRIKSQQFIFLNNQESFGRSDF